VLSRARTATKFFTYGMLIGVLFAPGSGEETRQRLKGWITRRG
jgi:gas vesicle protein